MRFIVWLVTLLMVACFMGIIFFLWGNCSSKQIQKADKERIKSLYETPSVTKWKENEKATILNSHDNGDGSFLIRAKLDIPDREIIRQFSTETPERYPIGAIIIFGEETYQEYSSFGPCGNGDVHTQTRIRVNVISPPRAAILPNINNPQL